MEEEAIQEWIEYHRSVGFEHFFIYGNDDDPRTLAEVLSPYITTRIVTYIHCPEVGAQVKMYRHFLRWHAASCEWLCFLDIDEFIRLQGYHNSVAKLTARAGREYDSVQLNWLMYGTSGFRERPSGSVLRQYTRRESGLHINTKHITRAGVFAKQRILTGGFWHALPPEQARCCSALFEPVSYWDHMADPAKSSLYPDYIATHSDDLIARGCIAHFHLKSEADLMRRVRRSIGGDFRDQVMYRRLAKNPATKMSYIAGSNAVEDRYLQSYWQARVEKLIRRQVPL
jgi:hypothetical protein